MDGNKKTDIITMKSSPEFKKMLQKNAAYLGISMSMLIELLIKSSIKDGVIQKLSKNFKYE